MVFHKLRALWIPTSWSQFETAESTLFGSLRSKWRTEQVPVGPHRRVNTLRVEGAAPRACPSNGVPLVLCHGFGLGVGAWVANADQLAATFSTVLAIDWLGCGRSTRERFGCKSRAEAEDFFVDSLEAWRRKEGIDKMVLAGHSFGGYMAACYAMKYPDRVRHLVMVSPVGVPHPPPNRTQELPLHFRALIAFVRGLWSLGVTPQGIIRTMGPWGKTLVERYVQLRFPDTVDKRAFGEYLYHNCAAPSSGENALGRVLAPGAYAYAPLCDRLDALRVPLSFVYGANDWMDYRAGEDVRDRLQHKHAVSRGAKAKAAAWPIEVLRVPHSGHQLFIDNPAGFVEALAGCVRRVEAVRDDR